MKRWLKILGALFVALNIVAFFHAWRMTHFVPTGSRTISLEKLSMLGKLDVLVQGVEIPKPEFSPAQSQFSKPPRTVSFTTRDGVRLEAWDIPAEAARGVVVMFHGYAVSRATMLGQARVLHELGLRTVLVDFRGSGGSEGMTTTLGWRESADVAAAANWARQEWPRSPLYLYGTSMGAEAVLRAISVEGVRPDGIVLGCPFDRLLNTIRHRYHAMGLPAFPFGELLTFWGGVQGGFNAFRHNPAEYARSVTCPALVMDGEHDSWVRPAEAQRVANAMRGLTQCQIFKNGRHGGYWGDASDEYRQLLAEWFNQRTGTGK